MALSPAQKMDALLRELARTEPVFESLGTPEPKETDAFRAVVEMGASVVPHLIERTREDDESLALAYVALALGRIGDRRAIPALQALRMRYEARQTKDMWDYAVIGQSNVALARLGETEG